MNVKENGGWSAACASTLARLVQIAVGLLVVYGLGTANAASVDSRNSSFRGLHAEEITAEAATLHATLTVPRNAVTAYLGTHDGGTDPSKWDFKIALEDHEPGPLRVSVEGLQRATAYYYTFRGLSPQGESWAGSATFTTKSTVPFADNTAYLQGLDHREIPAHGFISSKPATRWEEALISGNGKMGALVLSRPLDEKIVLSHERLFLPFTPALPPIEMAPLLPHIRELIRAGKYAEAAEVPVEEARKENYGSGWVRWTDPFIPAFDLLVRMDSAGGIRNYFRSEDFSTGVATVHWEDPRGSFVRRLFVSRADNVVVLSIHGPRGKRFDCELQLAQRPIDKTNDGDAQQHLSSGIRDIEISATPGWLTYRSRFARSEGGYEGVARVLVHGGSFQAAGKMLVVRSASAVLVLARIDPVTKYADADLSRLRKDLEQIRPDFDFLLSRHRAVHGEIFGRVKLDLNTGEDRYLPVEELQAQARAGRLSPALLEKVFDAGRYTILSASGDWPPNLQGKWTGTWGPPWSGDYTLDGNAEVAVASLLDANMPELMASFLGYLESLVPAMRENAQHMYGSRGILLPPRASTHGFHNHFNKDYPLAFWTAGAGWVAHYFYDYYLYTGDREFLADRAVPFMREVAQFYEDFLTEGPDGKYVFNPSYSPENTPRNGTSQAAINATMDIAVARDLLRNLIAACEALNVDREGVARWRQMLAKMPDYMINSDGAVKEWTWPTLEDNYEHRHVSHLYPLFFGVAPELSDDPRLLEAFRRAAQLRMQGRLQKDGGEMAFGLVELGQVATSLGDAQAAYTGVSRLATRYYYRNLMSSHDPGPSLFNADASGGLPDVVIRMLLRSEVGKIRLLPALPAEFPAGEIDGALARGQVLVKRLRWGPHECTVVLRSLRAQTVTVTVPSEITGLTTTARVTPISGKPNERSVFLPANSDAELTISIK